MEQVKVRGLSSQITAKIFVLMTEGVLRSLLLLQ
jgi:hypothetical protein